MPPLSSWHLVQRAANGRNDARGEFTQRFMPVVRAYFGARWRGTPLAAELEDAVQDVFLDCFKEGGALERVDPEHGSDFRTFLFGVVRNIALRYERSLKRDHARMAQSSFHASRYADDEAPLSRVYDRAWARAIMKEAAELQTARARGAGGKAQRYVELLRLRFYEGLQIRDIARLWGADPAELHHDYAQARKDFRRTLREVVAARQCCAEVELETECDDLLDILRS